MQLRKSQGTTGSEQFLATLCEKTFLGLWTYPNVYRDQRNGPKSTDGKELCDVLAVSGNDVIVFSDKSCTYHDTGNRLTDWQRWFRRTVTNATKQLRGAERWLQEHPNRIFVDRACVTQLPQVLPVPGEMRVFRIVVAHGSRNRCKAEVGGSGSLGISTGHGIATESTPFQITYTLSHDFVHIFDEVSLPVVLKELDTVTDFLTYLEWKEQLFREGKLRQAAGEEEILAMFLQCRWHDEKFMPDLPPNGTVLELPSGMWTDYQRSSEYKRKKNADRRSYLWDAMINKFTHHAFAGTLREENAEIGETEYALRHLARESRLDRRVLANSVLQLLKKAGDRQIAFRRIMSDSDAEKIYVIMLLPQGGLEELEYRKQREGYLDCYTKIVHSDYKGKRRVIGIATGTEENAGRSYDLTMREVTEWTAELQREADRLRQLSGWGQHKNMEGFRIHDAEYRRAGAEDAYFQQAPKASSLCAKKVGRNDRCPCGSTRKFKHCCGSPVADRS